MVCAGFLETRLNLKARAVTGRLTANDLAGASARINLYYVGT
jgi:hypothetical protein